MLQAGFRSLLILLLLAGRTASIRTNILGATINTPVPKSDPRTYRLQGLTVLLSLVRLEILALGWSVVNEGSSARGLFQVGHKGNSDYLPTD